MRGLNKLYYLKIDIENIQDEIRSLPLITSQQITGMPRGSGISEPVASYVLRKEELVERLNQKIAKYTEELVRIENIIETIDDAEVRVIARMRFVQCLKWEEIGEKVHLERTTCAKKLKKYIKSMDI
jgi:hypothetical protein